MRTTGVFGRKAEGERRYAFWAGTFCAASLALFFAIVVSVVLGKSSLGSALTAPTVSLLMFAASSGTIAVWRWNRMRLLEDTPGDYMRLTGDCLDIKHHLDSGYGDDTALRALLARKVLELEVIGRDLAAIMKTDAEGLKAMMIGTSALADGKKDEKDAEKEKDHG